jgi:alanyl-tRNA synthetase
VTQKGSLVDSEKLRFDFSHFEGLSAQQLADIEQRVNEQIRLNSAIETQLMGMDAAKEKGAMALFGEKYSEEVRVLTMGDGFSVELCGGTHAKRTGDIGLLRISSEGGVAAGVRRIEALTGEKALAFAKLNESKLDALASLVKANRDNVVDKVTALVATNKGLEKELAQLKAKVASAAGSDLAGQARDISGVKVVAAEVSGLDVKALENAMEQLKNKLGSAVIMLVSVDKEAGRVSLQAGVSKDLCSVYKAGDLMKHFAPLVGGKGGGKPEKAKGSGSDVAAVSAALDAVYAWVESQA